MSRFILGVTFFSICAAAISDECNCKKYPFEPDPPCYARCSASLVGQADWERLVSVLRVDHKTAEKISSIPAAYKPNNIFDYRKVLSKSEFDVLNERLKSLSQEDFFQLQSHQKKE